MELLGLHHVSILTGKAEKNYQFFTKVLGMRLVKKRLIKITLSLTTCFMQMEKGRQERK